MADSFTGNLPQPGDLGTPGGGGKSPLSAIGDVLGDFASGASAWYKAYKTREAQSVGTEYENAVTDLFKLPGSPSNPSSTPALAGEAPLDPHEAAATHDPTVLAHSAEMDRLDQAHQQGSINANDILIRAAVLTQQYINKNPEFADVIRARAQAVLGHQPTAALLSMAESDATTLKNQQFEAENTQIAAAAHAGIMHLLPDGSMDRSAMIAAGEQLNFADHEVDRLTKIASLQSASAGTADDQINRAIAPITTALAPSFEQLQEGMYSGLSALIDRLKTADDPTKRAAFGQGIGIAKAQWMSKVEAYIIKAGLTPDAATKLRTLYSSSFDNYSTIVAGPLSHVQLYGDALKDLKTGQGITFTQSNPTLAGIAEVAPQALTPFIQAIISRNPAVLERMANESKAYLDSTGPAPSLPPEHPLTVGDKVKGALTGGYDLSREQNPTTQSEVLRTVVGTYKSVTGQPTAMSPADQKVFGHAAAQITRLGITSNDPDNVNTAANVVNTPATVLAFQTFAKTPGNADAVPAVAHGLIGLNAKNLTTNLPILSAGSDVKITHVGTDAGGMQMNQQVPAHVSAAYNPVTGKLSVIVTAKDLTGKDLPLTPEEMQQAINNTGDVRARVDSMNRSLDTIVGLKDYSLDRSKEFKGSQLKQLIIDQSGFPTIEGFRRTPMPDFMTKPAGGQAPTPTPKKKADAYTTIPLPPEIDTVVKTASADAANRFHLDPAKLETLARATMMQESHNRSDAKSPTHVGGYMQVTRDTASDIGNRLGMAFNRDIPVQNVQAGIYHLAYLISHYGDVKTALRHYNGGGDKEYVRNVESRLPGNTTIDSLWGVQ